MSLILSFFTPVIFTLLTIYLVILYLKRRSLLSKLSWIPGPPRSTLFGNYNELVAPGPEEAFNNLKEYNRKYDRLYKIWIGPNPSIHCQDVDIIKETFKSDESVRRPSMYLMVRKYLGDGQLFGEGGEKWKAMRKYLTESFHTNVLEDQVKLLCKKTSLLFCMLEKERQSDKPLDLIEQIKPWFLKFTIESMIGVDTEKKTDKYDSYISAIDRMSDIVMARLFSPLLIFNFFFNFTRLKKAENVAKDSISSLINQSVSERRAGMKNIERDDKPKIVADAMLSLQTLNSGVTDYDVFSQVSNHIFASYDTLSTSVSNLLFLLGNNPEIQDDVVKEISSVAPNILTEGISLKDSNNLKLLERCQKEALRMFPSAALIGRRITRPINTKRGTIPAGVDLYLNMYTYHRNETFYPDPDRFDPDRFLPENVSQRHQLSWIPFGLGSRSCTGQKQALLLGRVASAILIKKYVVKAYEKPEELLLSANIMLKSKNGVRVYLSPRDN